MEINPDTYEGQLLFNEPLANYTTWRVGGIANKIYKPKGLADLSGFIKQLSHDEPLLWLGLGSNSLIRDSGYAGTVVLTQGCLKDIAVIDGSLVRVEAGVSCATMARFCARANLADGEFWAGIPGTMGGALRMNAGCSGRETWQSVVEVETMTRDGTIKVRKPEEFEISYRHVTGLQEEEWFVAATCRLTPGEKEKSLQLIKDLLAHRANTQPTNEYNCGSVFRNPPGNFAARLIESCGLKGKKLGGAIVSEKHANFIINQGVASSNDIESLIELVRDTVHKATDIELIREVHIIGDL
ncbi:MAG: UDP-N-acetylmuramate dehydrogenase [Tatlockia sp.]|nr:UDP-N-acetylmuramate dehydrogenase [Tatlockia sp.]